MIIHDCWRVICISSSKAHSSSILRWKYQLMDLFSLYVYLILQANLQSKSIIFWYMLWAETCLTMTLLYIRNHHIMTVRKFPYSRRKIFKTGSRFRIEKYTESLIIRISCAINNATDKRSWHWNDKLLLSVWAKKPLLNM